MTKSFHADTGDCSLPEAQVTVEAAMSAAITDIENQHGDVEIVSVQVVLAVQPYSLPIEGSYRDDHYTDRGYIGLILFRPR